MYSESYIQHIPANDKDILGIFKKIRRAFTDMAINLHKAQTAVNLAGATLKNKEEILKIYVK